MPGQFWPDVSHQPHLVTFSRSVLINSCEYNNCITNYYIPIVVVTYGSWGSGARQALSQLASRLAVRTNSEKSQMLGSLYGRLSLALVRANARAILNRSYCSTINLPDDTL